MKRAFALGCCVGVLLSTAALGIKFGGWAWVPFAVTCIPAVVVGSGFVYGMATGTGDVNSLDDAVSKSMEYRDDYDPEEEYGDE